MENIDRPETLGGIMFPEFFVKHFKCPEELKEYIYYLDLLVNVLTHLLF